MRISLLSQAAEIRHLMENKKSAAWVYNTSKKFATFVTHATSLSDPETELKITHAPLFRIQTFEDKVSLMSFLKIGQKNVVKSLLPGK